MPAGLQVEAEPGGRGVGGQQRHLAPVPRGHDPVLSDHARLRMPGAKPLQLVDQLVEHEDLLAARPVDDRIQLIELHVVEMCNRRVRRVRARVEAAGGRLGELACEDARVRRGHLTAAQPHAQVAAQPVVHDPRRSGHVEHVVDDRGARQAGQPVAGEHGQAEPADRVHDLPVGVRAGPPFEDHVTPVRARREPALPVFGDGPAQGGPTVEQEHLRPQVHEPFRGGRAGQTQHPVEPLAAAAQDAKPFRPGVAEAGQFVDDHGPPRPAAHLGVEPHEVLLVDDGDRRLLIQCLATLLRRAGTHRPVQGVEPLEFLQFGGPGVLRGAQRGDDKEPQSRVGGVADVHDGDGGQRLAEPHVQEQATPAGRPEGVEREPDGLALVVMEGEHALPVCVRRSRPIAKTGVSVRHALALLPQGFEGVDDERDGPKCP